MKRINFLGIAAVIVAFAASAFTTPAKSHAKASGQYWYLISNVNANSPVPQADAMFIQQSITPPAKSCTSGSTHQCVSGFDVSQVNTSTNQLDGTQSPETQSQLKN